MHAEPDVATPVRGLRTQRAEKKSDPEIEMRQHVVGADTGECMSFQLYFLNS